MFLDAARGTATNGNGYVNGNGHANGHSRSNGHYKDDSIFARWRDWPPSEIAHHGSRCCETAREWLFNIDMSSLNGGSLLTGPRWIRQRFNWGPGTYPVHWCDVIKKRALDCGVHAALAFEVFTNRGLRCYRAQFVQEFSSSAGSQWRSNWEKDAAVTQWIDEERIYHEGCAVPIDGNRIKIWDPSAGWWVDPRAVTGYGSILAIRISSSHSIQEFVWGDHTVGKNSWANLAGSTA